MKPNVWYRQLSWYNSWPKKENVKGQVWSMSQRGTPQHPGFGRLVLHPVDVYQQHNPLGFERVEAATQCEANLYPRIVWPTFTYLNLSHPVAK